MLLEGVGLNSSGDPGRDSSCWELVLWRLLVGLGRGEVVGPGGVRGRGMRWAWGRGGATQLGKSYGYLASFPAPPPPRFCFSVCVQYNTRKQKSAKNGEGLVSFIT